ncbi:hypothetical protein ACWEPH_29045 [Nocardia beijingensis]
MLDPHGDIAERRTYRGFFFRVPGRPRRVVFLEMHRDRIRLQFTDSRGRDVGVIQRRHSLHGNPGGKSPFQNVPLTTGTFITDS